MLAGTRARAVGVKLGPVVQRDGVWRMRGAEDMSAVPAVVPTLEQRKRFPACRSVADERDVVRLPMRAGGESLDGAEILLHGGHPVDRQTVAGGASAERLSGLVAAEAIGAVVAAPRRGQRWLSVGPLGGAERSGNVHGRLWRSELTGRQRKVGEHGRGVRRCW